MTKILSLVVGVLITINAFADGGGYRERRPGHVLFQLKKGLTENQQREVFKIWNEAGLSQRGTQVYAFEQVATDKQMATTEGLRSGGFLTEEQIAERLKATGAVDFAEPDYLVYPVLSFTDPYIPSEWHLKTVRAFDAWNTTLGRSSVVVTVCDSGVDAAHPDLKANVIQPGYNVVDKTTNSAPIAIHGTAVAGVIAGRENGAGVVGIAPHVRILPVRVTNSSSGSAYLSDLAACVRYAADRGSRVVNVSYSGAESSVIDAAATYARNKGTLMFMAAGNSGVDISNFPAYPSFVRVGSTTSKDQKSSFSNYGTAIDLVAPGTSILTTVPGKKYSYMSGTSFSSPLAAGVAALVFSVRPDLKPKDVDAILRQSAVNIGSSFYFGRGRVDAAAAVVLAQKY